MNEFWGGPAAQRTCRRCGHVIERAGAVQLKGRRISAVTKPAATKPAATKKAVTTRARKSKSPPKKAPARRRT